MTTKIGLLGLQGAIEEHETMIKLASKKLGMSVKTQKVTLPSHLKTLAGIVMPGGESSAMVRQCKRTGLFDELRDAIEYGLPAFGTCAGAILLAKNVKKDAHSETIPGAFSMLDIDILRNGYGAQRESFSSLIKLSGFPRAFEGVFIRAPIITKVNNPAIKVHGEISGYPVFIEHSNFFATTFHPELTNDTRIHELFLKKLNKLLQ